MAKRILYMTPTVAVQMMIRMAALDGTHSNLQRRISRFACIIIHTVTACIMTYSSTVTALVLHELASGYSS